MEGESPKRRLKRTSEVTGQTISTEGIENQPDPNIPRESLVSEKPTKKKPKTNKKIKAPKFQVLNKLVDPHKTEEQITEFEFLRDQPLQLESKSRKSKDFTQLLQKFKQHKQDKVSFYLAKGVLTNNQSEDLLEISTPQKIEGFINKKKASDPRELLRERLKFSVNERKTGHLDPQNVFEKSKTDLEGTKKQEEEDSDFLPESEEEQAAELQRLIDIEEGNQKQPENQTAEPKEAESEHQEVESEQSELEQDELEEDKWEQTDQQELKETEETHLPVFAPNLVPKAITKKRYSSKFFDEEAELGSDHEEHDNIVKRSNESEEERPEDDQDLPELVDYSQVELNQEDLANKHMGDMIAQDQLDLKKVINADFKRKRFEFLEETSGLVSKKMKLIQQRKDQLESRENEVFTKTTEVFSKAQVDPEDEDYESVKLLQSSLEMKLLSNQFAPSFVIDEKSKSLLNLIGAPEVRTGSRSLLGDSEKSESLRVFTGSTNFASNKSYVFSKDKKLHNARSN